MQMQIQIQILPNTVTGASGAREQGHCCCFVSRASNANHDDEEDVDVLFIRKDNQSGFLSRESHRKS